MKLLITGSTGHSGQYFLELLNENPNLFTSVRCVVRNTSDTSNFSKFNNLDIDLIKGDLNSTKFLEEALEDIDIILNIANIKFSPILYKLAREKNIEWMISVHTTGRYSNFKSASTEYIKIEDNMLGNRHVPLTILRPTMIYGSMRDKNMSKLIKFLDRTPIFPVFGNGKNLLQPVRAQDLAQAYYNVLTNPEITKNKEYDLSGQDEIEYKKIVNLITERLGKKVRLLPVPISLSKIAARFGEKFIPKFPITEEQVLRMQEDKVFSHKKAKEDFEYNPMDFRSGIFNEVDEYLHSRGRAND